MDVITEIVSSFLEALNLIFSGDSFVINIAIRSIYISGFATILALSWGIPISMLISFREFFGKNIIKWIFNISLGFPTVTLGLMLFLLFSRSGPLGIFGVLYTPTGIIIGQAILVTPILVSFSVSALEAVNPEIRNLAKTLGASDYQASIAVLIEGVKGVSLAIVGSFNRAVSELGIALMIGGNIRGFTRVLTTTIALETRRGEITQSIAIAIVLLFTIAGVNIAMSLIKRLWMR
jgi:tungstate transport system permease protein|tara:strand:- start:492 stop:1196 length:705 start_codon:yes stop_codon:yes gene_type:complete